jgi:glycerol-3-phosphate dehydrogenase (NAD(P)+)
MKKDLFTTAVLGAGYMGSAVTFPLRQNGHEVRLWGTWLDDEIIERCKTNAHPKLGLALPGGVKLFSSDQLAQALDGVDIVFMAVTSEGFAPVFDQYLKHDGSGHHKSGRPLFLSLTKGFVEHDGGVERISKYALQKLSDGERRWISIGGPVKAPELARGVPTVTVYAGKPGTARLCRSFATPRYRVIPGSDPVGMEVCSAFKNIYAIAVAVCDGIYSREPAEFKYDNFKSLVYTIAIREMVRITEAAGGEAATATGYGGIGDLFLTQASGRNGMLGKRVGSGEGPAEAYHAMLGKGQIAEGYHALKLAPLFLKSCGCSLEEFPLLHTMHQILFGGRKASSELFRFVESLQE